MKLENNWTSVIYSTWGGHRVLRTPSIDSRGYNEILAEAIKLIPHYCPEWTNHSPSDPGMTLLELFAWMTEDLARRLNTVPDAMYLTLLDLIGLSLLPPQPARVLLSFAPVNGFEGQILVPRGTEVSTEQSEDSNPIVFETDTDLTISTAVLESCISTKGDLIADHEDFILTERRATLSSETVEKGFSLFTGKEGLERHIYLCDPTIGFLADQNICDIAFHCANEIKAMDDEIVNCLEWEYWNGTKWVSVDYTRATSNNKRADNEIFISGPLDVAETEVEDRTGFFLRASLVSIPGRRQCFEMNHVDMRLLFEGEGLLPDQCLCNTENMLFTPIDTSKSFKPFFDVPRYNDAFYLASDEVFSKTESVIVIDFNLIEVQTDQQAESNRDLVLKYEYWSGRGWEALGVSRVVEDETADREVNSRREFEDQTQALVRSGKVQFRRPADMKMIEVNTEEHYWIRVRISAGDFGKGGEYAQDAEGNWSWSYDRPVEIPEIRQIRLRYVTGKSLPQHLLSYYNFEYVDLSAANSRNYDVARSGDRQPDFFDVIEINLAQSPTLFLGFSNRLPSGENSLYFKLDERRRVRGARPPVVPDRFTDELPRQPRTTSLRWEYWSGGQWSALDVADHTDGFHESGFVTFTIPENHARKKEFGKPLFWVRVILESGSFETDIKATHLLLNGVYAMNRERFTDELLGSSNGTPGQEFEVLNGPLLQGIELMVHENATPPQNEQEAIIAEEGEDAITVGRYGNPEDRETWIRYHEVENFYASKPFSRHFCVDYRSQTILFGDGAHGIIPPEGQNNIVVTRYSTGGGSVGNVGPGTVDILRESIPYVAEVTNPFSAEGGADSESLDKLKARATHIFKNRSRAVTAEDFEWLAMEASTSVARAKCLSRLGPQGEVELVIVPEPDSDRLDYEEKMYPTQELRRRVKEYLDVRKLIGTKLRIESPTYRNFSLSVNLALRKGFNENEAVIDMVETTLRTTVHPVVGDPDSAGWPFGHTLTKGELLNKLMSIGGVYMVEDIQIMDDDLGSVVEELVLKEDELLFLGNVSIATSEY